MHARRLQHAAYAKSFRKGGFDSCMREDCNDKYAQISVLISVHSYDFAAYMFYVSVILCLIYAFAWSLMHPI